MKHGKKLTRKQKELLTKYGYDYNDYLLERQDPKSYTYIHKLSKKALKINKRVDEVRSSLTEKYEDELEQQKKCYEHSLQCSNKTKIQLINEKEDLENTLKETNETLDITLTNLDTVGKDLVETKKIIKELERQLDNAANEKKEILKLLNGFRQVLSKDLLIKQQLINAMREKSIKTWKLMYLITKLG